MSVQLVDGSVRRSDAPALIDAEVGSIVTYEQLDAAVDVVADALRATGGPVLVQVTNSVATVVQIVGCLRAGVAALLLSADAPGTERIVEQYRPTARLTAESGTPPTGSGTALGSVGGRLLRTGAAPLEAPRGEHRTAILLPTSGSTGNPKLVRLSASNLDANATSIAAALEITAGDRAPTSLPLDYSYGLSVVTSHLRAGAALVVTPRSVLQREFWTQLREQRCTSFAGVPYTYQMLLRLKLHSLLPDTMRSMTQAGGRLAPERVTAVLHELEGRGVAFSVMYGQTEATARMAVVPPPMLAAKLGSAGRAIPGGRFEIDAPDGDGIGEVLYHGPNVMLGYAECREDLAGGDECGGVLRTGDVGTLDDDGYLWLSGRSKRIGKLFGVRVSLDDLEDRLAAHGICAATSAGDAVELWFEEPGPDRCVVTDLARQLRTHVSGFCVRTVPSLPRLGNGKIDYRALEASR